MPAENLPSLGYAKPRHSPVFNILHKQSPQRFSRCILKSVPSGCYILGNLCRTEPSGKAWITPAALLIRRTEPNRASGSRTVCGTLATKNSLFFSFLSDCFVVVVVLAFLLFVSYILLRVFIFFAFTCFPSSIASSFFASSFFTFLFSSFWYVSFSLFFSFLFIVVGVLFYLFFCLLHFLSLLLLLFFVFYSLFYFFPFIFFFIFGFFAHPFFPLFASSSLSLIYRTQAYDASALSF